MDFESEEDAKQSMCPKTCVELLGVSEWDGKGRANNYPFGFLLMSHTGKRAQTYIQINIHTCMHAYRWYILRIGFHDGRPRRVGSACEASAGVCVRESGSVPVQAFQDIADQTRIAGKPVLPEGENTLRLHSESQAIVL